MLVLLGTAVVDEVSVSSPVSRSTDSVLFVEGDAAGSEPGDDGGSNVSLQSSLSNVVSTNQMELSDNGFELGMHCLAS